MITRYVFVDEMSVKTYAEGFESFEDILMGMLIGFIFPVYFFMGYH
jgi:hypothetical protein